MSKQVYISADYAEYDGDRDVVEELNKWGSDNFHKVDFIDMSKVASGSVSKNPDCRICDLKQEFNRQINASSAVTGFVSVLYPIDSNHIRNWIWKNRIKRYRNHERMYICSTAAVGKQCSTLSVAADSGFSVWKRGIHWSRDYIRTN